jgi:hypothetical protein
MYKMRVPTAWWELRVAVELKQKNGPTDDFTYKLTWGRDYGRAM